MPIALVMAGAWAAVTPLVAAGLGVDIGVTAGVEIVDHVLPGGLAAIVGTVLLFVRAPGPATVALGAAAFLAGLWVFISHLPLLADAGSPPVSWPEAALHASSGVPLVALGAWAFASAVRAW